MGARRILIVDDEEAIATALDTLLTQAGYGISIARSGREALALLTPTTDLVILDIMLPDMDGYEVCRRMRQSPEYVPILMLTARDEPLDKLLGLELGADLYLTKPFEPRELLAHIKALFRLLERRSRSASSGEEMPLVCGSLTMWDAQHRVELAGQAVDLTPKEYELLRLFMRHPGRAFGRETLLRQVWGYEFRMKKTMEWLKNILLSPKYSCCCVRLVSILTLLLSGCVSAKPWEVTPALQQLPPPPTAAPVAVVTPRPTALPAPARLFLSLSPWPLHGPPPFTAGFFAQLSGDVDQAVACQSVRWAFGDGTDEVRPCSQLERLVYFQASHVYSEPGTYHVRLALTLADEQEVSSTTQTVVVAVPQPVSQSEEILRRSVWGLSLLAAVGALVWLRRRSRRWKIGGYALVMLGLITFVPPFSYLPNPIGLYWAWVGGYAYDPRLPFVNRFVIAGDPTTQLRPFLDGLIGHTGLDPLDPVQPLARYEFVRVSFPRQYFNVVQVTTRLTYRDGSQRTYDIPLYQSNDFFGFYRSDWWYDGLGRLRTEHRELPGTPFVTTTAPVRLAPPQRLPLHPEAHQLNAASPASWGPSGFAWQHLAWSPQGDAFLVIQSPAYDRRDLWQVKLDGSPPIRIAQNVADYNWSPDGRYILFTQPVHQPDSVRAEVFAVSPDSREQKEIARLESLAFPGLSEEGVWYSSQGALWLAPYDDATPRQIAPLLDLTAMPSWGPGAVIRPAPDGTRIAYTCVGGAALCLQDREGGGWTKVEVTAHDLTWSPDGSRLAAVTNGTYGNMIEGDQPVVLTVVRRNGQIERSLAVVSNGWADAPQWTPDGNRLFVQTYPFGGRRILTADVITGEMLDLSQPRWDAWFTLPPDGTHLFLSNGRGGFWLSELIDSSRTEVISYTVQPGDSLFSIADKFELHPETILWANEDTLTYDPERIRPGVTLNILPVNGIYYEWKVWDDLAEVAKRYNVRVEDILNWPGNHLDPNRPAIQPGTMLILPGGYPTLKSEILESMVLLDRGLSLGYTLAKVKLPNHESAVVPRAKIVEYLLSSTHREGRGKARFFTRFGFSVDSWAAPVCDRASTACERTLA